MEQLETLQISIHLNLLLAQNNLTQNDFQLASHRVEDARLLMEELKVLIQENPQETPYIF